MQRGVLLAIAAAAAYFVLLAVAKAVPRYDCIVFVGIVVAIFHQLDGATERARSITLHVVTQIFLAAFLVHLWSIGYEGRNAVFGGVLPWSDSHDFYDDALRLVHGERFTEISSKRPIFTASLAVLLRVTGGDLRLALAACAVVGAWATATAALEVWKTHGFRSAVVVYLVLVFFERRWTGFVQTEHAGLPFGVIGFALIWRANALRSASASDAGAHEHASRLVLVGLFSLTLGLVARAGSFFVLPAIVVWALRALVPRQRRDQLRFVVLAAGSVLFAFVLNKTVLSLTGAGVMFSDYPPIVYGLMHQRDYTYLTEVHPALVAMPVAERVPAAWRIVLDEAASSPSLLLLGCAKSALGLFTSPYGMFSYVWTNPDDRILEGGGSVLEGLARWQRTFGTYSLASAFAMGALGVFFVGSTLWAAYGVFVRDRRAPELSLLRWSFAGVVASAPFLPPWITSGQQVQTVTLAFVAALPAVVVFGRVRRPVARTNGVYGWSEDRLAAAPLVFMAVLVASVVAVRAAPVKPPDCAGARDRTRVVRVLAAEIEVASERALGWRTNAVSDLRASLPLLERHNADLTKSVTPYLRPGTRYVSAFDACDRRAKILVDDTHALPTAARSTWVTIIASPLAAWNILGVEAHVPVLP